MADLKEELSNLDAETWKDVEIGYPPDKPSLLLREARSVIGDRFRELEAERDTEVERLSVELGWEFQRGWGKCEESHRTCKESIAELSAEVASLEAQILTEEEAAALCQETGSGAEDKDALHRAFAKLRSSSRLSGKQDG